MKATEFCYWLQGYLELKKAGPMNSLAMSHEQVETIGKHLDLVFTHDIDPSYPNQAKLDEAHGQAPGRPRC